MTTAKRPRLCLTELVKATADTMWEEFAVDCEIFYSTTS